MQSARVSPFLYLLLGMNFGMGLINYLVVVFVVVPAVTRHG